MTDFNRLPEVTNDQLLQKGAINWELLGLEPKHQVDLCNAGFTLQDVIAEMKGGKRFL